MLSDYDTIKSGVNRSKQNLEIQKEKIFQNNLWIE